MKGVEIDKMNILRHLYINWLVKKTVLPALYDAPLSTDEFVVDKPTLRIKISVSDRGRRTFTIHQKTRNKKTWIYTTYAIDAMSGDDSPFALRSGSYPGAWNK